MPSVCALAAAGVAFVVTVLFAVSTGTRGWIIMHFETAGGSVKTELGLFESCVVSSGDLYQPEANQCQKNIQTNMPSGSLICGDHTLGTGNSLFQATQAVAVISAVSALLALLLTLPRVFGRRGRPLLGVFMSVKATVLGVATLVLLHITLSYMGCGEMPCDNACTQVPVGYTCTCGYNYSMGLCIVSVILSFGCAIVQFIRRNEFAAGNNTLQSNGLLKEAGYGTGV